MEFVTDDIIIQFQIATKYDIQAYIDDYVAFTENEYNSIVNYYSGKSDTSNQAAFSELDRLYEESKRIIELFELNGARLQTYDAWILLEQIETIQENLLTIQNLPKYLRSTIDQSSYNTNAKIDYSGYQGSTLESISSEVAGSSDPDAWVQVALKNNLREEDYTPEGGYIIGVELQNQVEFALNTVVQGIATAQDTYGLDIDKNIIFEDDDLKVLGPNETIEQAALILVNLKKGDNPAFPDQGIDPKLAVGRNQLSVAYPVLFRQLAETIATDDTFRSMAIKDIRYNSDSTEVDVELQTQAGQLLPTQTLTL